jgi:hypothetical protein
VELAVLQEAQVLVAHQVPQEQQVHLGLQVLRLHLEQVEQGEQVVLLAHQDMMEISFLPHQIQHLL